MKLLLCLYLYLNTSNIVRWIFPVELDYPWLLMRQKAQFPFEHTKAQRAKQWGRTHNILRDIAMFMLQPG
jgi:hypothetical protein